MDDSFTMLEFAMVSRHAPSQDQINKAAEKGIKIVHVGDVDAFNDDNNYLPPGYDTARFSGIITVHPLIAVHAYADGLKIGCFENVSRPGPDGKPQFVCGRFIVIDQYSRNMEGRLIFNR